MKVPTESKFCIVLIKTGSNLNTRLFRRGGCTNSLPTYCMYEYDHCFVGYELRFGDGSGLDIDKAEHADLIEVPGLTPEEVFP
jgi:hypothetical protein